jgi:tetratricopeptide (TPR) repeat protein
MPHRTLLITVIALTGSGLLGCMDADLRRGRNALGQGNYSEAVAAFERARARKVKPRDGVRRDLAGAHRAWGAQHLAAGECAQAAERFSAAEASSVALLADHQQLFDCRSTHGAKPADELNDLRALYAMGDRRAKVLRRLFDAAIAADSLDEAYTYAPLLEARYALSTADRRALLPGLLAAGRIAAARDQLERLLMSAPASPIDRLKLAELREQTDDVPGARALYVDLVRRHPNNPVVHLRQAAFLTRHNDRTGAALAQRRADSLRGISQGDRRLRPLLKSRH